MCPTDDVLAHYDALVPSDNEWQREARLRQALWREEQGLPMGLHRGRSLGSRLAMPFAKDTLANYMTEATRMVVRAEVLDAARRAGKMYREPRIFEDLLSSQPLCFNLFAELQQDLALASAVFRLLLRDAGLVVTAIEFEHSPGRGDPRFTGDHSAFDVFVTYASGGAQGFIGIEVKYAERLDQAAARHRQRYDEVAAAMGCFREQAMSDLRQPPLEQLRRDHLLVGSLLLDPAEHFRSGTFGVIYPAENVVVAKATESYLCCLSDQTTFKRWTLETVVDAVIQLGGHPWAQAVRERYLGCTSVERKRLIHASAG
jgi:hypothetical protein